MGINFPRRGQTVADHEWRARTVGIAKASGMWEAPQVPNSSIPKIAPTVGRPVG